MNVNITARHEQSKNDENEVKKKLNTLISN